MFNIAWLIASALLGFLVAWLIRGTKINANQTELESTTTSYAALQKEHEAQRTNLDKLNAKHSQLTREHNSLNKRTSAQETQIKELEGQLQLANNRLTPQTEKVRVVDNSFEVRSLESKVSSLEKTIAFKDQELERLNEENENLATKVDMAEAGVEEAQEEKAKALAKLKQYESYRPRFEEANLERNSIKYKYEQLLAANTSSSDITGQLEEEKAALAQEIATLKNALDQTHQQKTEIQTQLQEATKHHQKRSRTYDDLQLKYDTLLVLQERTEAKLKAFEVGPES